MIVVIVIAILATIAVSTFIRVQKISRDTKRKEEMRLILTALQGYYTERSVYPITTGPARAATVLAVLP